MKATEKQYSFYKYSDGAIPLTECSHTDLEGKIFESIVQDDHWTILFVEKTTQAMYVFFVDDDDDAPTWIDKVSGNLNELVGCKIEKVFVSARTSYDEVSGTHTTLTIYSFESYSHFVEARWRTEAMGGESGKVSLGRTSLRRIHKLREARREVELRKSFTEAAKTDLRNAQVRLFLTETEHLSPINKLNGWINNYGGEKVFTSNSKEFFPSEPLHEMFDPTGIFAQEIASSGSVNYRVNIDAETIGCLLLDLYDELTSPDTNKVGIAKVACETGITPETILKWSGWLIINDFGSLTVLR